MNSISGIGDIRRRLRLGFEAKVVYFGKGRGVVRGWTNKRWRIGIKHEFRGSRMGREDSPNVQGMVSLKNVMHKVYLAGTV